MSATSTEAAWFATLPTLYGAAAALFTDQAGRVLLVKPNYRDHWSLPGGVLEHGEPPHVGCAREVAEEIGLDITPGRLLVVDWIPPEGDRPRPIVHFVFDGGMIAAGKEAAITLQEEELDDYGFVAAKEFAAYLPPRTTVRVTAALRARDADAASAYVAHALGSEPCPWQ
jgi:ADP-ribose pyrophosphatase YjhB (NUDIX family)